MAQSKTAKKRKKAGHIHTGCMALSYVANKGAAYAPEREDRVKRERKNGKRVARYGDGGD